MSDFSRAVSKFASAWAGGGVPDGFQQSAVVEPVDPFEGGIFYGIEATPWTSSVNDFCLEQPIDRFGQCIVVTVADAANQRGDLLLCQPFGVFDRQILGGFNRSSQHPILGGVDDKDRQTKIRTVHAGQMILARATACLAA